MVIKKKPDRFLKPPSFSCSVLFGSIKIWLVYLQMILNIAFYPAILNGSNHDR